MSPFVHRMTVRFHEVDPAGIVFFGRVFRYAHDAYEEWMRSVGLPLEEIVAEGRYLLPLAHAEADYHRPLRGGQALAVVLEPVALGECSFTLRARLSSVSGDRLATVTTVHVCTDPATGRSQPLPGELRRAVAAHLPVEGEPSDPSA